MRLCHLLHWHPAAFVALDWFWEEGYWQGTGEEGRTGLAGDLSPFCWTMDSSGYLGSIPLRDSKPSRVSLGLLWKHLLTHFPFAPRNECWRRAVLFLPNRKCVRAFDNLMCSHQLWSVFQALIFTNICEWFPFLTNLTRFKVVPAIYISNRVFEDIFKYFPPGGTLSLKVKKKKKNFPKFLTKAS